jgi:hypothetical protein
MRAVFAGVLAGGLLVSPAFAQSSSGTWNGLSDRFQIDTGYFRINADTVLRYNGEQGSGDVDFEKDLGIDEQADTFWIEATWRLGRRHKLKLGYTKLDRDRADYTLQRDITWGGETYDAGLSASTSTGSDILGGYYRFALFRNDRFEIGPTIGVGYLWLNARVEATGTVSGPGGSQSRSLDERASTGSITGAVGGFAQAWPAKRLTVYADYLYIKVTPEDTEASVTDWRAGANFYFGRHVGLGAEYKHYQYRYDRGILASELGGEITYAGFQLFASFLF